MNTESAEQWKKLWNWQIQKSALSLENLFELKESNSKTKHGVVDKITMRVGNTRI